MPVDIGAVKFQKNWMI